jgi:hypothetical protein
VPSVVQLDLAGLFYALWSPNAAVVEGAVKLMLTPSEDALWGMSQLVNASTPVAYAANASAFQTLPPCNSVSATWMLTMPDWCRPTST